MQQQQQQQWLPGRGAVMGGAIKNKNFGKLQMLFTEMTQFPVILGSQRLLLTGFVFGNSYWFEAVLTKMHSFRNIKKFHFLKSEKKCFLIN